MAEAISDVLDRGAGWKDKLQTSLFTGGRFQAVADAGRHHGGVVQPSYGAWILALGVLAIASSLVAIALLTNVIKGPWAWNNRSLAAAYALAMLASFNLVVMHLVVHALSPAGQEQREGETEGETGMSWNEASFWRSLFCLALSLPYLWYLSLSASPSPPPPTSFSQIIFGILSLAASIL